MNNGLVPTGKQPRGKGGAPSVIFLAVLLFGCDSGHDGQLPPGAVLSMTPAQKSITVEELRDEQGRCLFDPNRFVDVPIVVSLRNASGSPLGGVSVRVYVDFADNTFGPAAPLALYEDRNGNGIVDADAELASADGDDIAELRMDAVHGAQALLLRMNLSCSYRSEVFAYVDGVTASASVEVAARDATEEELDESPDESTTEDIR